MQFVLPLGSVVLILGLLSISVSPAGPSLSADLRAYDGFDSPELLFARGPATDDFRPYTRGARAYRLDAAAVRGGDGVRVEASVDGAPDFS